MHKKTVHSIRKEKENEKKYYMGNIEVIKSFLIKNNGKKATYISLLPPKLKCVEKAIKKHYKESLELAFEEDGLIIHNLAAKDSYCKNAKLQLK